MILTWEGAEMAAGRVLCVRPVAAHAESAAPSHGLEGSSPDTAQASRNAAWGRETERSSAKLMDASDGPQLFPASRPRAPDVTLLFSRAQTTCVLFLLDYINSLSMSCIFSIWWFSPNRFRVHVPRIWFISRISNDIIVTYELESCRGFWVFHNSKNLVNVWKIQYW